MKPLQFLSLILLMLSFSCTQKPSGSEGGDSLSGVFANNQDTLKITANMDMNEIEFDITAQNDQQWKSVFNSAPHLESTNDAIIFTFQDSSEYSFEDLTFTFNYSKKQWEITDIVFQNNSDINRKTDLSGIYLRVN